MRTVELGETKGVNDVGCRVRGQTKKVNEVGYRVRGRKQSSTVSEAAAELDAKVHLMTCLNLQ